MDYLKYAIRKKYIASAKSYLVPKVLILWATDVVFRVKLKYQLTLLSLIILKNITKFMELPLCGKAIAVD